MARYTLRRTGAAIIVLLILSFVAFMLINLAPGNALLAQIATSGSIGATTNSEQLALFEKELGLDRPVLERYGDWLWNALQGDLGKSLVNRDSVAKRIGQRLPTSIELLVIGSIVAGLAVPLGVMSAVRHGGKLDYSSRVFAILGLAIPNFFIGIIVILIFSRWFNLSLPTVPPAEIWEDPVVNLQKVIAPGLVLGVALIATVMRMARSSSLEVLNEDYVRTARAKGLRERVIVMRHVVRNSMIPIITIYGNQFAFFLGGAVIIEQLFLVPGIGQMTITAINQRDYPLVMGATFVLGTVVVFTNLVVDLSYGLIDPRIRYG